MSLDCRILVISCPRREPIQRIWAQCFKKNWSDCPFPVTMVSPELDVGWNNNLLDALTSTTERFILLLLDDYFIDNCLSEFYTPNMTRLLEIMDSNPQIGLVKVQASYAASPDIASNLWDDRLKEYDRRHHPFKRTNLVPTMFRKDWLVRLSNAVLNNIGVKADRGRAGANAFEIIGTLLTENAVEWPERMFGINRDDGRDLSLLQCIAGNGLREGYFGADTIEVLNGLGVKIVGCEAFLPA